VGVGRARICLVTFKLAIWSIIKAAIGRTAENSFIESHKYMFCKAISRRSVLVPSFRTMATATASKVHLDTQHRPVFAVPNLSEQSASKTSELLQENHDKHHIFFNREGFHVGESLQLTFRSYYKGYLM
jgi:hypothetical protein